jgi:hypothetical protein
MKLGIRPSDTDTNPTHAPVPDAGPESRVLSKAEAPGVLRIRYEGAKPQGCENCEIRWQVGGTAPAIAQDMKEFDDDSFSHNPWKHDFGPGSQGSLIHYALRWVVADGKSPWSEVRTAVVP